MQKVILLPELCGCKSELPALRKQRSPHRVKLFRYAAVQLGGVAALAYFPHQESCGITAICMPPQECENQGFHVLVVAQLYGIGSDIHMDRLPFMARYIGVYDLL